MARMEKAGRSIVETVEATPAKAKQVRRIANYYLPDAVNVLQQYAKLAKQAKHLPARHGRFQPFCQWQLLRIEDVAEGKD